MPTGTSIAMKNLFFNVPARRNFLKSNAAELRHIVDEFIRVAMSFPEIFFSFTSNGQQVFHLEKGSIKTTHCADTGQQLCRQTGDLYRKQTDYMNIYGFVGKPETAKKTRGDQYFFVNNRFIKSAYLNHAVMNAFDEMIAKDSFPMYTLFIDLDPSQVDINVHPTKQEIKFEDEKLYMHLCKVPLNMNSIFTARSRSSSGYFRCAAMTLHPPRFHGLQDSRGGPVTRAGGTTVSRTA